MININILILFLEEFIGWSLGANRGRCELVVHVELSQDQNISVHAVKYTCAVMKIKIVSMTIMK